MPQQSTPTLHTASLHTLAELRRLSDASRLGSLKNKSSCAGFSSHCSDVLLSFHRYLFPSLASSAVPLCVSPPLGLCAALVGARVLNKSMRLDPNSWSALTLSGQTQTVENIIQLKQINFFLSICFYTFSVLCFRKSQNKVNFNEIMCSSQQRAHAVPETESFICEVHCKPEEFAHSLSKLCF